jgi:hypothetical protein
MKTLVEVRTYLGGAAQRWHSASGNGTKSSGRDWASFIASTGNRQRQGC